MTRRSFAKRGFCTLLAVLLLAAPQAHSVQEAADKEDFVNKAVEKQFQQTSEAFIAMASVGETAEEFSLRAQSTTASIKDKVNALEQQLKEEKEALQSAHKKGQDAQAAKKSYQTQSTIVSQQIQELTEALNITQAAIASKENEISEKQAEIDERRQSFKDQMAAMQMMNDAGAVAMLANVKSLYELLTFADTLQQISRKQTGVLEDMQKRKQKLEEIREDLEAHKLELEEHQAVLDHKKQELAGNIQNANNTITSAQAEVQAQQVQVETTSQALREAREEFDRYISSLPNGGGGFVGEEFIWPTTSHRITQNFGENGHGGTDIGAPGGAPIYAAASGVVQVSTYHQHTYSYGNYVVLDHGGGIKTLYAHMSSRAVSVGQVVKQGDIIGYVGNTGYSFGNHLHFEVRVNGKRVNPMGYY